MDAKEEKVQEKVKEEIKEEVKQKPIPETRREDVIEMRQLLECGVHFGHQTKRWNPKMKPFIFTARNGIHVIDLQKSIKLIKDIYFIVKDLVAKKGDILFVGTKKQAQEAVEAEAKRCNMPFVNHRWLGGTLTNNITIRQSVNKLKKYNRMLEDGTLDTLSNKEASRKKKNLVRLEHYLGGIQDMAGHPAAIFIIDTKREQLAVNEARKLKIPIIGLVDTNADPTEVDYPIPGNDDAIRAIKLISSVVANAVNEGMIERAHIEVEEQRLAEERKIEEEKIKAAQKEEQEKLRKKLAEEKAKQVKEDKEKKEKEKKEEAKKAEEKPVEKTKVEDEKSEPKKTEKKEEKVETKIETKTAKKEPVEKKKEETKKAEPKKAEEKEEKKAEKAEPKEKKETAKKEKEDGKAEKNAEDEAEDKVEASVK